MGVGVPNRVITRQICASIRAGHPVDRACVRSGVDAPTLRRWLALGEVAFLECEKADPHGRFFAAFIKALECADQASEADDSGGDADPIADAPRPKPPSESRGSERRTRPEPPSEMPCLVWEVVEEAPIEIRIGSRPAWVYETSPSRPPTARDAQSSVARACHDAGASPAPGRPETSNDRNPGEISVPAPGPSQPTLRVAGDSEADPGDEVSGPIPTDRVPAIVDPRPEPSLAVIVVDLVAIAIAVIVVIALVVAIIPVVVAGFVLIGATRGALASLFGWRAGVLALRGGGADPCLFPVGRAMRWTSTRVPSRSRMVRRLGAVALTGRTRPQRE